MRKKGSWFSAIKRVFTPSSKEKPHQDGSEKLKTGKEKNKWGYFGRLISHGENSSFINLHREPSSIENILREAESGHLQMEQKYSQQFLLEEQRITTSATSHSKPSQRPPPPAAALPTAIVNRRKEVIQSSIITPEKYQQAIKIQAAFRGYLARRSFRALKGLVRLQGVMRGQSVKRQTVNAKKRMQLLVRVQMQIQSRRIQTFENHSLQLQHVNKITGNWEAALARWITTQPAIDAGPRDEWDDSILTKEEIEARLQRKMEAIIKREKALVYAYSQQLFKTTPESAKEALMEIRSGGLPWWENHATKADLPSNSNQPRLDFSNLETNTPISSKSTVIPNNTKHAPVPTTARTTTTATTATPETAVHINSSTPKKHVKSGTGTGKLSYDMPFRDDESLMSCPPFSVPNYMVPTISAKAKVRDHSNPKERSTPPGSSHNRKRRLSFPLTQSIGSIRWNKSSFFSSKDTSSHPGKQHTLKSISNMSMDSIASLPAGVGRKPFMRFV